MLAPRLAVPESVAEGATKLVEVAVGRAIDVQRVSTKSLKTSKRHEGRPKGTQWLGACWQRASRSGQRHEWQPAETQVKALGSRCFEGGA